MWQEFALGEVTTIINGGTPKSNIPEYWGGSIPWITPKDMGSLKTVEVSQTSRTISDLGLQKSSAKLIPANSVILSTRAPIGHLTINKVPMAFNQGCRGIEPKPKLDARFLFYFLKANVDLLDSLGTGTTFKELSKSALSAVKIPLPPLPEQKRIVAILDEAFEGIDTAIANTQANLTAARELFENYVEQTFANQRGNWKELFLGQIAEFRNGLNFTRSSAGENINIVGVKDFQKDFFVPLDKLETVKINGSLREIDILKDGDILAVRSNGNKELIGRCLLAKGITAKTSHSGFTIRIRLVSQEILSEFLTHFMKSTTCHKMLVATGGGTNISNLNQKALSSLLVRFPPISEQKKLGSGPINFRSTFLVESGVSDW